MRRYHGLVTAATKPPVGRIVLLSKLEETILVNDKHFELSTSRSPGVLHPQGLSPGNHVAVVDRDFY
ncbi:MAG: glycogen debranching enzyme N-terminal domain-containing protein [Acidobacteriaceae bacterium]